MRAAWAASSLVNVRNAGATRAVWGGAREEQRDLERAQPLGDFTNAVERCVVAADVDVRQPWPREGESGHLADERLAAVGAVQRRYAGNVERRAIRSPQLHPFPACETPHRVAQPLPRDRRREHSRHRSTQLATGPIEVVGMLVVREQDRLDSP